MDSEGSDRYAQADLGLHCSHMFMKAHFWAGFSKNPFFKIAMSGRASGIWRCPMLTFWLTFSSKLYFTFIFQWIAFIFGRVEEEDQ